MQVSSSGKIIIDDEPRIAELFELAIKKECGFTYYPETKNVHFVKEGNILVTGLHSGIRRVLRKLEDL